MRAITETHIFQPELPPAGKGKFYKGPPQFNIFLCLMRHWRKEQERGSCRNCLLFRIEKIHSNVMLSVVCEHSGSTLGPNLYATC